MADDQGAFGKVIRIENKAFQADAGHITFSEIPIGSKNPFYSPSMYGGDKNGINVAFAGYYVGQRIARSGQCGVGASASGCVVGTPEAPLRLSSSSPDVFAAEDGSNPTSPSLSGSPKFNGPISMLFDRDVAGVGLAGGFFDTVESTAITAFDRNGRTIGGVHNLGKGMEYMALVTENGRNAIAGIQFSLVGPEAAGYAIDELTFALAGQLDNSQIKRLGDVLAEPEDDLERNEKPSGGLSDLFGDAAKGRDKAKEKKPSGGLSDLFKD
ncbi:PEP-CTERM sorting domain-containing protein [Amylibacter sp. IMCC11727]|uniref:PEP-CTERM sorting domain-containing protein n=1 Tax=Amylibacter sp. IMCC11727 TaxID=3039851 RepID=UPI00244DD1D8|nr:PEP-CTERM sorting domain-containing protein [Amylibacter sp. IMCC11727]WGI21246.1 PEP-CTERM sorting domain-containing protein [Amylibacter sp. IMCC11727]